MGLTYPSLRLRNVLIYSANLRFLGVSMVSSAYLWILATLFATSYRCSQKMPKVKRTNRLANKSRNSAKMRALRSRQQLSAIENQQATHKQQESAMQGTEANSQVSSGTVNTVDHNHVATSTRYKRAFLHHAGY